MASGPGRRGSRRTPSNAATTTTKSVAADRRRSHAERTIDGISDVKAGERAAAPEVVLKALPALPAPELTIRTSCSGEDSAGDSATWCRTIALTRSMGDDLGTGKTYTMTVDDSSLTEKTYTLTAGVGDSTYTLRSQDLRGKKPPETATTGAPVTTTTNQDPLSGTPDTTLMYLSETTNTYTVAPSTRRQRQPLVEDHRHGGRSTRRTAGRRGALSGGPLLLTRRQLLCYPVVVSAALGTLAAILAVAPRISTARRDGGDDIHHLSRRHFGGLLSERSMADAGRCSSAPCRRDGAYLARHLALRDASPCQDFERYACQGWRARNAAARSADQDQVLQLEQKAFQWLRGRKPVGALLEKCVREKQDGDRQLIDYLLPTVTLGDFPFSGSRAGSVAIWRAAARVLMYSGCAALLSVHVKPDGTVALGLPDTLSEESDMDAAESTYRALAASFKALTGAKGEGAVHFALRVERAAYYGAGSGATSKVVASQLGELWAFVGQVRRGLPSGASVTLLSPSYVRRLRDIVHRSPPDAVLNYLALRLHFQAAPLTPPGPLLDVYEKHTGRGDRWRQCFGVALAFAPTLVLEASRAVTGAAFLAEQAAELVNEVRHRVLDLMVETPLLSEAATHLEVLRKARLQLFGPPWSQNPKAVTVFEDALPRPKGGQAALRSWATIAAYELESRVSRESWPARWALERACVLDAASGRLALPPLLLNESTPGGVVGALQFSRAGARLASCLLRSLLALEPTALPPLPPAAAAHVRHARSCLDGQKRGKDVRESLPVWAGLRPALRVFKERGGGGLSFEGLPELSGVQLFFVYWALDQCSAVVTQGGASRNVINAAVANEPSFHEAFLCTPQSPMNPLPHCQLWRSGVSGGVHP
ncbi:hypothetical protein HPB52_011083 [Rhipicephalus sanguineus]|uniref:Uncharacterized protein n=1 Tax=Rhipicephalus sanguineus TaxID=34632 RepID=A0A9D4QBR2_RHISA|nr:hypothetical protein HPB52_011083 [Rhipicephalus sanguineus]